MTPLRSVAIGLAQPKTLHFEPALRRDAPALVRPLSGFSNAPFVPAEVGVKARFTKPESISKSLSRWEVDHDSLQKRTNDFPLERTSRVIRGAKADVVARRISNCLQARSIETKFSKTETFAKCRNTDFVKFYIRLFLDDDGVLVEVQRLCGDCVSFMHDCRAVLDASEGHAVSNVPEEKPLYLRLPVTELSFMKSVSLPPLTVEDEEEEVNLAADLLASNRSDSNMLGMESLVSLTDSTKTVKSTAVISSKRILCPDVRGNESFNMHNYIMSLVIYGNESNEKSWCMETALEDHGIRLRNLAMCSLSNALELLATEGCLLETIDSCYDWYVDVLIPRLVHDLTTAGRHPHDACYASRCVSCLASSSSEFANKFKEFGGLNALKNSEEVGRSEFALLVHDSVSCRDKIVGCCA